MGSAAILLAVSLWTAQAQDPGPAPDQQAPLLAPGQLDDLVAPIALYPDPLLSQVLVASTYPLEIVQAQQWLQRNPGLGGQQLTEAARSQNWDASVQALVAMPDVLTKLNQDLQWTTALGNAFLAQQADVMAAVQRMRARAQSNGRLATTPQQTVTTEMEGGQSAIEIEPADPQVIYVPVYDPAYIWGPAYYAYPSLYYGGYGFGFYPGINLSFCFGGWGGWGWGGWGWGWGPNWFGRSVFVNGAFFNRYGFRGGVYAGGFGGRAMWQHDPGHRLGVSYPTRQLSGRYGAASLASRSAMPRSGGWNGGGARVGSGYDRRPAMGSGSGQRSGSGQWQRFQGGSNAPSQRQNYSAPQQRYGGSQSYSAPQQRYGGGQSYSAPQQRYGGGQSYSAPQQRYGAQSYSAPQQRYGGSQSYSAPQQRYGGGQSYSAPQQRYGGGQSYSAPQQRYGGGQGYSAPQQRYGGGQSYSAPQQRYGGGQSYSAPQQRYGGGQSYSAPQQRYGGGQSYSAPQQRYGGGQSYSAPRQSAPSYSAPRQSAPSYSAPRQSAPSYGGGGRSFGGGGNSGGGSHSSGGGGGHRR